MRFIRDRKKLSPQPAVDRLHFVVWDFLKMLTMAVLCGLGISIAASIFVILLSSPVDARALVDSSAPEPSGQEETAMATPGALLLGDGCDARELPAIERDWYVRIYPGKIEVRVMQTFVLPAIESPVAIFHVQLPAGAALSSFAVLSDSRDFPGVILNHRDVATLTPARYRAQSRRQLLVAADETGSIATSPLLDLHDGETVVVQYTYLLAASASSRLELPLESGDTSPVAATIGAPFKSEWQPSRARTAGSSVWVEWPDQLPASVSAPAGTSIDWSRNRIQGVSWAAPATAPGAQFVLGWFL
jgi:hypothetical protein